MFDPSDEKNHCSSRRKFMLVSASVTPGTERSSASTFINSAKFRSTEIVKGSTLQGVLHSAVTGFSGTSRTSLCFTFAEARAIATACAAVRSIDSRSSSAEDAKPQAPSTITRTLRPCDRESDAVPILPFLVDSARLRSSTTRTSA